MKNFCNYVLLAVTIFSSVALKAQVNTNDSLALIDLYNNTDGPNWKKNDNWLTAARVAAWYGITVSNNRVTEIKLNGNSLQGILPASFGNLTALTSLKLYSNKLTGSLPKEIGNLLNLSLFDLANNELIGGIPKEIGNLLKLESLYLSGNSLTDTIPSSIGNLTSLSYLDLSKNELTGNIPSTIGNIGKVSPATKYIFLEKIILAAAFPEKQEISKQLLLWI